MAAQRDIEQRFAEKWESRPGPLATPCWIWTACLSAGYGKINYPGEGRILAHRASWLLAGRELPAGRKRDDLILRHRCGVRSCVNPDHLLIGTRRDNYEDALRLGELRPDTGGWGGNRKKLTDEQVREIRASPLTARELATVYPVTPHYINAIRRGEYRADVT